MDLVAVCSVFTSGDTEHKKSRGASIAGEGTSFFSCRSCQRMSTQTNSLVLNPVVFGEGERER